MRFTRFIAGSFMTWCWRRVGDRVSSLSVNVKKYREDGISVQGCAGKNTHGGKNNGTQRKHKHFRTAHNPYFEKVDHGFEQDIGTAFERFENQ